MRKKASTTALSSMTTDATIEALKDIIQLNVCRHAPDAASATREGAVLLGISRVDNDGDGDGFRYLIGLRRGTSMSPFLRNFF